jgi:cytoskeletal protein RodZ
VRRVFLVDDPIRTDNTSVKVRDVPAFRTSPHGYDRAEVDQFVRAEVEECAQLRQRVTELEATLDATLTYLQSRRQSGERNAGTAIHRTPAPRLLAPAVHQRSERVRSLSVALLLILVSGASAWVVKNLLMFKAAGERPPAAVLQAQQILPARKVFDTPSAPAEGSSQRTSNASPSSVAAAVSAATTPGNEPDLMVVLTAQRVCWIAATLDGQRRVERLMQAGEVFALQAHEQMLLRVGNAGALSVTINGLVAAPLGKIGQPVTTRITVTNYRQLLSPS